MFPKWDELQEENIKFDIEWIKNELKDLTREERCLILDEYVEQVKKHNISMNEYQAIVKAISELEEN